MEAKLKLGLREILAGNLDVALVTITEVKGSTPRKPGAKMLVFPNGQVIGSIGGGCGEAEVIRQALQVFIKQSPTKYSVNMTNDMAEEDGMVCGGIMEVFIDYIKVNSSSREFLTSYLEAVENNERPIMATIIDSPNITDIGRKLYFTSMDNEIGEPGTEKFKDICYESLSRVWAEGKTRSVKLDKLGVQILFEPVPMPVELLILGGGHIALPLVSMAKTLGYKVTVVDDRPFFASQSRFPYADEVICDSFDNYLKKKSISEENFIIIVTRGHRYDKVCLREVVNQPASYIGMIGSRRRVKALMSELRDEGIPIESLEKVYSPIGLDIAAETPEEIALCILGEIINVHRGGKAQSLKLKSS